VIARQETSKSLSVAKVHHRRKQKGPLNCGPLVELPGIESGTEIAVSWGNAEFDDAKVRETTRNYLRIRERY
jgi:hypothetical protein